MTERECGSHFSQPASWRSGLTAAAIVRSSGLCRHAACTTSADAMPDTTSSAPCTPRTPASARSHVIGTPDTSPLPAAAASASARRSSSPPRSSGADTSVGTVPSPTRNRRKSAASRPLAQRSAVRSSARRARSARSGATRRRSTRSSSTSDVSSLVALGGRTPERLDVSAEPVATGTPILDPIGDDDERRHQGQGEELHLAGEGEHRQAGTERGEGGEHLEPAGFWPRRHAAEVAGGAFGDDRRAVRRAVELDLAELVDALARRSHERAERDTGGAEADDVVAVDGGRVPR